MQTNPNEAFERLLRKLAEGDESLAETARRMLTVEWEAATRLEEFPEIRNIALARPLNLNKLRANDFFQTRMGGFAGVRSQVNSFLKHPDAVSMLEELIGDGTVPPSAEAIDRFVDRARSSAFVKKDGKPAPPGLVLLLASMLLTSVWPRLFVDYQVTSWVAFAEWLGLELAPAGATGGQRLYWAGQVAREACDLELARGFVPHDVAPWAIAGLVWRASHDKIWDEIETESEAEVMGSEQLDAPLGVIPLLYKQLASRNSVILQGPPGTGKTFAALELVRRMANGDFDVAHGGARSDESESASKAAVEACQWSALRQTEPGVKPALPAVGKVVWELVQMHPGYAYEDFVRGLETDPSKEGVHFRPVDRIVLELAEVARQNPDTTVVLIMDEINRCNLSSVLGELILALEKDKRDRPIRLQYGGSASIPKNLWFIGTMNTADRSIAHIDYAIRRRFRFIDIPPTAAALESWYKSAESPKYRIAERVMRELNGQIAPPNLHVGPAYFMEEGEGDLWTQRMADRLVYEVLPLLREYVAEDRKVLDSAKSKVTLVGETFSLDTGKVDPEATREAAARVFRLS